MPAMESNSTGQIVLSPAERSQVVLLRHFGLPVIERIQRMPVGRHLPELERSQWWRPEQLRSLQETQLRRLVPVSYTHLTLPTSDLV